MSEPHWDPKPQEREWYREAATGQLGWLVRREGQDKIRLDREAEEILRKLDTSVWVPQLEHRPLNTANAAMVAFDADRSLCRHVGLMENSRKEWASLSDDQRIAWMTDGPTTHPIRAALFRAVQEALEPHTK